MRRSRHCDDSTLSSLSAKSVGQVEPAAVLWRVMPFEALVEAARLAGREGLVERSGLVRVQIVLDEHDLFGVREHLVGDVLERMGVIDRRVALGHQRLAPSFERREDHEDAGGSVALILIIDALRSTFFAS